MCKTASRYPGQPANTGNEYFPDFSKAGLISQTSYRVREIERSLLLYLSDCVDYFFRDKFDEILKQHFKMSLATFSFQSSQRNTCSYTTCTFTMFVFFFRNEQSNKQKRLATRYRVPLSLKKHTQVIQDHTSLSIRVFALRNSEEKNNCCRILLD